MMPKEVLRRIYGLIGNGTTTTEVSKSIGLSEQEVQTALQDGESQRLVSFDARTKRIQWTHAGEQWWGAVRRREDILDDDSSFLLTALEKGESESINLGLLNVSHTAEELGQILSKNADAVRSTLERLAESGFVLRLLDSSGQVQGYRSRTAEVCRLNSLVRQRVRKQRSLEEAPRLVSSVKWIVKERYRLERHIPIDSFFSDMDAILALAGYKNGWGEIRSSIKYCMDSSGISSLSDFQLRTARHVALKLLELDKKSPMVSSSVLIAPTGQGKTEAYFLPTISYALARSRHQKGRSLKLISLYPREDLSVNQFERFAKYVTLVNEKQDWGTYVGLDNGTIEQRFDDVKNPEYQIDSYKVVDPDMLTYDIARCPVEKSHLGVSYSCQGKIHVFKDEKSECEYGHALRCKLTKESIYRSTRGKVDTLVITPGALSVKLTQEQFMRFLVDDGTDMVVLVLDEIHLLYGLYGASVSSIIRRFKQLCYKLGIKVYLVGLSATIVSPDYFFGLLTESNVRREDVMMPYEDETALDGIEHYFFIKPETSTVVQEPGGGGEEARLVKPISTVIQTAMATLHNSRRRYPKHRAVCFIDSIDVVKRLNNQLGDAESDQLFSLRSPDQPWCNICSENRGAVRDCPAFAAGDCWWFMRFDRDSVRLDVPLTVIPHHGGLRGRDFTQDLVISTSKLEVGFDDPQLLYMFGYGTPPTVASFVQRKGRVGREAGDRPIISLVLSPYKARDMFYYLNHDLIVWGDLTEVPFSPDNYHVEKEAWRIAILDCMVWYYTHNAVPKFSQFNVMSYATNENLRAMLEFITNNRPLVMDWLGHTSKLFRSMSVESKERTISLIAANLREELRRMGAQT